MSSSIALTTGEQESAWTVDDVVNGKRARVLGVGESVARAARDYGWCAGGAVVRVRKL